MRAIPVGQLAANVMFQLRPDDTCDLDEALFAAIDALTVKDSRENLCITNLLQLQAAARAVTESGQPCDWQKAGTKLWSRLVGGSTSCPPRAPATPGPYWTPSPPSTASTSYLDVTQNAPALRSTELRT